jgi:two-component system, NtrC family, response regulator AtoC
VRVLAIDDDAGALRYLVDILQKDHEVSASTDSAEAVASLRAGSFDLVVTDLRMPPPDGFEILAVAQALVPPPPVIVLSAMDTARAAVEALRLGARDFLVKPAEPEEIARTIAAVRNNDATREAGSEPSRSNDEAGFGLAGDSPPIRLVRRLIRTLAASREAVLLLGETGTGKELLARALHASGPRAHGPFVAHNMAATPSELAESIFFGHMRGAYSGANADHPGLFECADGGTLFLDEMDSFPLCLQAKLLRALESGQVQRLGSVSARTVDVRVIASSAVDPVTLVAQGTFRADLYYRLRQLEVLMPPLRERAGDIPALVQQFLEEIGRECRRSPRLSPAALVRLTAYSWPGNVRELRNVVREAALMATEGTILPEHLPRMIEFRRRRGATQSGSLRTVETEHILRTVESVGGNGSQAARILGIDRGTLARKLVAIERERRKG